jgi:hypothetical protein
MIKESLQFQKRHKMHFWLIDLLILFKIISKHIFFYKNVCCQVLFIMKERRVIACFFLFKIGEAKRNATLKMLLVIWKTARAEESLNNTDCSTLVNCCEWYLNSLLLLSGICYYNFFLQDRKFCQLHEEVLNDEIRETDPLEDFCEVLNSWLKKKGLAMPYYICVGTSGSDPYFYFIITCQCHHGSDLTLNPATPLSHE